MNTTPSTHTDGLGRRRTPFRAVAVALAMATLIAACGDDEPGDAAVTLPEATDVSSATTTATTPDTSETTETTDTTTPETTTADTTADSTIPESTTADTTPDSTPDSTTGDAGGDDVATACNAYTDVTLAFNDEPDPDALANLLDELESAAPGDVATELATMIDAARQVLESGGEDFSPFETPEFQDAMSTVDPYMFENCEFEQKLEATAHEYRFEGLPDTLDAGRAAILFSNHGNEAHELALMRKAEGVTESWDEILELPEEEAMEKTVQVGGGFAGRNGDSSLAVVDLEPGDYIAICFIPVGTSITADGEVTEGSGPPHFTQGMRHEFVVG